MTTTGRWIHPSQCKYRGWARRGDEASEVRAAWNQPAPHLPGRRLMRGMTDPRRWKRAVIVMSRCGACQHSTKLSTGMPVANHAVTAVHSHGMPPQVCTSRCLGAIRVWRCEVAHVGRPTAGLQLDDVRPGAGLLTASRLAGVVPLIEMPPARRRRKQNRRGGRGTFLLWRCVSRSPRDEKRGSPNPAPTLDLHGLRIYIIRRRRSSPTVQVSVGEMQRRHSDEVVRGRPSLSVLLPTPPLIDNR